MHPGAEDPREGDSPEGDLPERSSQEDDLPEINPLEINPLEDDLLENDLFGPDSIEESLTDALNDLEKILDSTDTGTVHETDDSAPASDSPPVKFFAEGDDAEQYIIPLLNDVVIPGIEVRPQPQAEAESSAESATAERLDHAAMMAQLTGPPDAAETAKFVEPELDEAALRRRLADRLASEVEVIVQARLELALKDACDDIRIQVRNHLDIILPEIVDDMLQHRQHNKN